MSMEAEALRSAVDALLASVPAELPPAGVQAEIAVVSSQVERLLGWLSTAAGELAAATGGRLPTEDGRGRSVAGWLAEATRSCPGTAGGRLRTAAALRSLPRVTRAVLEGVLTQEAAGVLARLVGTIPAADLTEAEPALIEVAVARNPTELSAYVRHLIATHCEPVLEAQQGAGRARRVLVTRRDPDGTVHGRFVLASEDSEALLTVLEPLARRQSLADDRSAAQRRADALVEVFQQVARFGDLPAAGGARPLLTYVLPAGWAVRQSEREACRDCRRCPAHTPACSAGSVAATVTASLPGQPGVPAEHACATAAWSGPQTRARIETVLCEARIDRLLLDGLGQVQGLESLTDSVTPAQRRALAARDGGCTVRGCSRPPAFCDAHHLTARADGGAAELGNLVLLCRRHHVLWHLGKIGRRHLHLPGDSPPATGPAHDPFAWSAPPPE